MRSNGQQHSHSTSRARFRGRVALVTGGGAGIGRAVVTQLCEEGAAVRFVDVSPAGAEVQRDLSTRGFDTLFFHGDVASKSVCEAAIDQVRNAWGRIDYLVNNAFSFTAKGLNATEADWERCLRTGPIAYANLAAAIAQPMREIGGGAIVNVSSISAHIAQPNRWTYNSAKGAVHTLTKCMALDLAPYNIRVNSVSPGWIWTDEVDRAAGGDRSKWEPVWGEFHMLRRCGEPRECAAVILFLLSDDASFVTAADLAVDGGYRGLGSEGLGDRSKFAGSC